MESGSAIEYQTAIVKRRQEHAKELRTAARREVLAEDDVTAADFDEEGLPSYYR